jgi:hydroxymethylpyrimidine/phosphomethylpyrimidine kinase
LAALGVHGVAVITALTYQNTIGVNGFSSIGAREFTSQLDVLEEDIKFAAVKIGMLAAEPLARALEPRLARWREEGIPVVFDPVFRSGGGQPLYEGVPEKALIDSILPYISVLTPNTLELAYLLNEEPAQNLGEMRTQVRVFHSRYNVPVFVTGGHLPATGDIVDILFTGAEMREFRRARVAGEIHGTGCLLSAALTAGLSMGADLLTAAERAEDYVTAGIMGASVIGGGALLPDRTAATAYDADRWRVYTNVLRALKVFENSPNSYKLVPEVGTNIVYALPDARTRAEVCGLPGRIIRIEGGVRAVAAPAFGASSHMARAALAVMKADRNIRAAMNIRCSDDIIGACRELNWRVAAFDRAEEPAESAVAEGRTLEWGIERAVTAAGCVPDVVFDRGAVGKEAIVRLFAADAFEVVRRAIAISRRLA